MVIYGSFLLSRRTRLMYDVYVYWAASDASEIHTDGWWFHEFSCAIYTFCNGKYIMAAANSVQRIKILILLSNFRQIIKTALVISSMPLPNEYQSIEKIEKLRPIDIIYGDRTECIRHPSDINFV